MPATSWTCGLIRVKLITFPLVAGLSLHEEGWFNMRKLSLLFILAGLVMFSGCKPTETATPPAKKPATQPAVKTNDKAPAPGAVKGATPAAPTVVPPVRPTTAPTK